MSNIKQETISGVKWGFLSKYSNSIITFVTGIILSRLLSPGDYGVFEMITIFFAISDLLIDSGFSEALIRKKDLTQEDASTVFYFNIGVALFCYLVLFLTSPLIASFFNQPQLSSIVKVSGLSLIFGAFGAVQRAITRKRRDFKTGALIGFFSNVVTTPIIIILAYSGWGIWTLVFQQLIKAFLTSSLYWIFVRWVPLFVFSKRSFKEFFSFGGKMLTANLFSSAYAYITPILIGRYYSPTDLGFYSKGKEVASMPSSSFFSIITGVTFPILANIKDDNKILFKAYSKFIRVCSILIFFAMLLLIAIAKPVVLFIYSEKWTNSIIFLQLFSFATMFVHIGKVNQSLMLVKGRSDLLLRMELIKKIILFGFMAASLPFGVIPFAVTGVIGSNICLLINIYYTGKYYGYTFKKQAADFLPYLLIAIVSCIPAFVLQYFISSNLLAIIICSVLSLTIYVLWLWKKRDEHFFDILRLIPIKRVKRLIPETKPQITTTPDEDSRTQPK